MFLDYQEKIISNRLQQTGTKKKKIVVRKCKRKKRVSWCRERKNWTVVDHWKNWIFSDECQLEIGNNLAKVR